MIDDINRLDQDRMIVLSLKARFAEAILAGDKSVELRRTEPKIFVPTRALLYATTPVRALLGTCIIAGVRSADPRMLWNEYGPCTGVSYPEFQQYFEGVAIGTALTLTHPKPLDPKIPLEVLRASPRGFRPPQSYAYVDTQTGDRLMQTAALTSWRIRGDGRDVWEPRRVRFVPGAEGC